MNICNRTLLRRQTVSRLVATVVLVVLASILHLAFYVCRLSTVTHVAGRKNVTETFRYNDSTSAQQQNSTVNRPKAVIAYGVAVTSCSYAGDGRESAALENAGLVDAAAVLKHSIHLNSIRTPESGSMYDYKLYAFVHPTAQACQPLLENIGFHVTVRNSPVELEDIRNRQYAEIIRDSGCCGEKEFMKLYTYTLKEHPIAVSLDLDTILLKPFDDLYDVLLLQPSGQKLNVPTAEWNKTIDHPINAFFVRDYNMNKAGLPARRVPAQGGFLVHQTNLSAFDELKSLIVEGDFKIGRGWGKEGWGGVIAGQGGGDRYQGLISYYYSGIHPNTAVELNHCLFDQMVDPPFLKQKQMCRIGEKRPFKSCPDCRKTALSEIYSAHFTLCKKPWMCIDNHTLFERWSYWRDGSHRLCMQLHHEWHRIRHDLEVRYDASKSTWSEDPARIDWRFYNHCRRNPSAQFGFEYVPISAHMIL